MPDLRDSRCQVSGAHERKDRAPGTAENGRSGCDPGRRAAFQGKRRNPVAPLKQRVYAGICTFLTLVLINEAVKEFITIVFFWLFHPPASIHSIQDAMRMRSLAETLEVPARVLRFAAIFLIWPLRRGATYSQDKLGIVVIDEYGDQPTLMQYFLRMVGHLGTLLASPFLFFHKLGGHPWISLGDRLSRTTQVALSSLPKHPVVEAFRPLPLIVLAVIQILPLKMWHAESLEDHVQAIKTSRGNVEQASPPGARFRIRPRSGGTTDDPSAANQPEAPAAKPQPPRRPLAAHSVRMPAMRQHMAVQLATYERQYHQLHTRYTDDIYELIALFGSSADNHQELILLAASGKASIRLRDGGFELGVELTPGHWSVISHKGL